MKLRSLQFLGLLALASAGCRAPASPTEPKLPTPGPAIPPPVAAAGGASVAEGAYSAIPPAGGGPSGVTQASASAPCADDAPPKRGWRSWLPTKDHSNDPRRERGEFTNGWYEPEYRGMTD